MERLLQDLGGLLRLAAITFEALLGFEIATLSGFGLFFGVSFVQGAWCAPLFPCGSLAVEVGPSVCDTSLLAFVRTASPLCHALSGLPAFFCQPSAVYICPNGLPISTPSSARLIGLGRVGDDL